ncbi:MAG: kelch domain-containing protein, partial [Acidobacteria bacterium]
MSSCGLRWLRWVLTLLPILVVSSEGMMRRRVAAQGGDPSLVGQWGPLVQMGIEAIHTHVLPTGKVLMFGYHADEPGMDTPRIWDPDTGSFTLVSYTRNVFCSGHSFLADGRLFVTGGHIDYGVGIADTALFDPFALTWTRGPDMNAGRWYPTNTTLSNGEVLVVQGTIDQVTTDDLPQVYNPATNTIRDLTSARLALWKFYPFMFVAPNGKVFEAGPSATTGYLDTSGTGTWTSMGDTQSGWFREDGNGVMYDVGKVLILGGGSSPPTASAEVIDLNQPAPSWRSVSPMSIGRRYSNSTLLPDGKVLVTGGSCGSGTDNETCAVLAAEMWDPAAETFATMASASVYRGYHSTAVLLPDARVFVAGGDKSPTAYQIYSPPYLFRGARPTVSSAPTSMVYGQTFFVGTPNAPNIAGVVWIRLGSVTHAFD